MKMMSVFYQTNMTSQIFIVERETTIHIAKRMTPFGHIVLTLRLAVFVLAPQCWLLGKASIISFTVFGLTRLGIKQTLACLLLNHRRGFRVIWYKYQYVKQIYYEKLLCSNIVYLPQILVKCITIDINKTIMSVLQ